MEKKLAVGICVVVLFGFSSPGTAGEPLIPVPLNEVLSRIEPGMKGSDVKAILSTAYPKVKSRLGTWSGQSGYIDFQLNDRYVVSLSAWNSPMDSPSEDDAIVSDNVLTYIFDHQEKHRLDISHYQWDRAAKSQPTKEPTH